MTCDGKTLTMTDDELSSKRVGDNIPCGAFLFGEDIACWWMAVETCPGERGPVFGNRLAYDRPVFG